MFEDLIARFNSINPFNNNIYYAASIWGALGNPDFNKEIIEHLKRHGSVLTEQLFLPDYASKSHLDLRQIHDRDIRWIRKSKRVVAEVTAVSLGVGYELREAVRTGKKVLGLYFPQEGKRLSAMIAGSPGIRICPYMSIEEAKLGIDSFFRK